MNKYTAAESLYESRLTKFREPSSVVDSLPGPSEAARLFRRDVRGALSGRDEEAEASAVYSEPVPSMVSSSNSSSSSAEGGAAASDARERLRFGIALRVRKRGELLRKVCVCCFVNE